MPNFKGAPIQTFGNASRMELRGPGQRNLDFSVFKDLPFGEKRRVEFRGIFQLDEYVHLQSVQPDQPRLTVGNASFGKLASSQTVGRQLQGGLKLVW